MADVAPTRTTLSKEALDRLFASSDDEDNGPSILPDLDTAQVVRDAQRKARVSLNLPATGTSGAGEADVNEVNGTGATGAKRRRDDEDEEGTKRRVIAKIDAERLLGEYGFPALIQQTATFKPKGKGHEKEDLDRVMTIYQLWAHRMFPKRKFIDTVERVEKVCREKRMLVALSVWRDELNPYKPDKEPIGETADVPLSDDDDPAGAAKRAAAGHGGVQDTGEQARGLAPAADAAVEGDSDDEAIWEEIMNRMKANNAAPPTGPATTSGTGAAPAAVEKEKLFADDDEDALLDEMRREEEQARISKAGAGAAKAGQQIEDEDALWDELMREEEPSAIGTAVSVHAPASKPAMADDDDEDMMALMREAEEQEAQAVSVPVNDKPPVHGEDVTQAPQEQITADDDDWERLYD